MNYKEPFIKVEKIKKDVIEKKVNLTPAVLKEIFEAEDAERAKIRNNNQEKKDVYGE